ncbi:Hsp70 family protein [Alienimonas californiensis]|uniref:Chaperone protein DnaK n=1 Tax=Alienimonas californiensis TaxID=2527989 RepID=A0A517PCL8_9PLAN|nr:Hsp70 family protein [Alienimonas californiensis]QDT17128.1 Chaperone protein DnaK [Alienimonas californiensis]
MTAEADSSRPADRSHGANDAGGGGRQRHRRRNRRGNGPRRPRPLPVGIDFGTDSSSLADFGPDGAPHVQPNARGELRTASAVNVSPNCLTLGTPFGDDQDADETQFEGDEPESGNAEGCPISMAGFKRMYQDSGGTFQRGGAAITAGGGPVTPKLLGAAFLRGFTRETAGNRPEDAPVVMTVPHAFTRTPRDAVRAAGRIAGLNVAETLSETSAAALAWLWKDTAADGQAVGRTRHALIYDLGAGTFDAAIVRTRRNELHVVAAEGDPHLGGRDWTETLAEDVAERFREKHDHNPFTRWRARQRLLGQCERAKLRLSQRPVSDVPVIAAGRQDVFEVTRDRFEGLTQDLLRRTRDLTEFLLENAGLEPEDLDVILPVGGAAAMPAVRRMLGELFGPRATPDHAARKAFPDPRTAVAEGAAVYAAMLRATAGANGDGPPPDVPARVRRRLRAITLEEVSAHSVGVEIEDANVPGRRLNHVVLPRGVRLPTAVQMTFGTTVADAEGIRLRLVEGERPEAADCDRLGEYRITGLPPGLPVRSPVTVHISLDERNAPHVTAHRALAPGTNGAQRAHHNLAPLTVEPLRLAPGSKEEAEARNRLARLMPHPR